MVSTPMQLDMTISVGNLLTAAGMLVAIFAYLVRKDKRSDLQFLALQTRMEAIEKSHAETARQMERLGDVFVIIAKYDQKFLHSEERQGRLERQIDELRHGKGIIN